MFRPAESDAHRPRRRSLPCAQLALLLAMLAGLGGCAAPQVSQPAASRPGERPQALPVAVATPPAPTALPPATTPAPAQDALSAVLAYADKVRTLPSPDLATEAEQLRQRTGAQAWLQLSLVQAHKQPPDLARAQELAAQAQGDSSAEGQRLQGLARLLASRYAEQRRLEEQLDKQNRQLIEVQKRLDQSLERLEALKAIERSLGSRAPAAASSRAVTPIRNTDRHLVP